MRLPKMMKYSVAVTAEGTSVWPQMRMMRPYSRMTMVLKPTQRIDGSRLIARPPRRACCAVDALTSGLRARDRGSTAAPGGRARRRVPRHAVAARFDEPHEDLFEPVHLVAHAEHFDAERRQAREDLVEVLLLRHFDLERVIVHERAT